MRELRQHASRYLERVSHGERIRVTDRGRPVATLVPADTDHWDELHATGRVVGPADDLLVEPAGRYGVDASDALATARRDER